LERIGITKAFINKVKLLWMLMEHHHVLFLSNVELNKGA
jgi:hypothetical protein